MGTKMVATWRADNLQWVSELFIRQCDAVMIMKNNVLWQTKRRRMRRGRVRLVSADLEGIPFVFTLITIAIFDTSFSKLLCK